MTPNEAAALQRARAAIQSVDSALTQAKLSQHTQLLKARIDRLDLQLQVAKAERLLHAGRLDVRR